MDMAKDAIINARVESGLKHKVDKIFHVLGLSPTEAITLFYKQIELNKGLPFDIKVPNKLTKKTLKDSASGKNVKRFKTREALYADLGI
jgi:DNA-damage-inducible protein J